MGLIRWFIARWRDYRRERRIADLAACVAIERDAGRLGLAQEAFEAMAAEIRQRSPQQVARLERRRGIAS